MDEIPDRRPDSHGGAHARPALGRWLRILLGGVAVGWLLLFVVSVATMDRREDFRRSACTNNLKQIGLGLHNYHEHYHALPPAYTVDAHGKRLHSWRTLILPYVEGEALYRKIDLSKPWDDPVNAAVAGAAAEANCVYICPSNELPPHLTTYLAVVTPNSCFRPSESVRFPDISDGLGQTLAVIEVDKDHAIPWMSPSDADEQLVLSRRESKRLVHDGDANALFLDGHVQILPRDTPADKLRAMISIDGNDGAVLEERSQ